jgi:hypothetical protein
MRGSGAARARFSGNLGKKTTKPLVQVATTNRHENEQSKSPFKTLTRANEYVVLTTFRGRLVGIVWANTHQPAVPRPLAVVASLCWVLVLVIMNR